MNIILLKDLDKVGEKNEVVEVKPGYARNYLIPKGLALVANAGNMAKLDEMKAKAAAEEAAKIGTYKDLVAKLESSVLKIPAKAGSEGKIFGSVTNVQVAQALNEQLNIEVIRKKIELLEEVKTLGNYTAKVRFHPEVEGIATFEVYGE